MIPPRLIAWGIKLLPYALAAIALAGVVWYLDDRGYQRAKQQGELTAAKADLVRKDLRAYINTRVSAVEDDIQNSVMATDANLSDRLTSLKVERTTIFQPTITKELANDPRYTAADGITVGVFDSLNRARAASGNTCTRSANGGISCSLPGSNTVEGSAAGNAGQ